ncbi:hypothetical protein SKAU_G00338640 [Synaphobranchus kaupii]|uniref:acylphosphatase n=1 Tax=Synaphobranchus kaupii TaxID=118154 RepID=A0A9Q1EMK8_SYNKA|nr:hypothetical protein SKAU_G00338640 [Synaphobranchus kaupii]
MKPLGGLSLRFGNNVKNKGRAQENGTLRLAYQHNIHYTAIYETPTDTIYPWKDPGCEPVGVEWNVQHHDSKLFRHFFKTTMSDKEDIIAVDYEIFGRVQGVFFRKYTQAEGKKLGLVGCVQNTEAGTVQGQLQGPSSKVKQMQEWLKTTGSPKSQIIKAEFKNERKIESLDHRNFKIIRH